MPKDSEKPQIDSGFELNPKKEPFSLTGLDPNKAYYAPRNNAQDIALMKRMGYEVTHVRDEKSFAHDNSMPEKLQRSIEKLEKNHPELAKEIEKIKEARSCDTTMIVGDNILMETSREHFERRQRAKTAISDSMLDRMKSDLQKYNKEINKYKSRVWQVIKENGRER